MDMSELDFINEIKEKICFSSLEEDQIKEIIEKLDICKHKLEGMIYHRNMVNKIEKEYKYLLTQDIKQLGEPDFIYVKEAKELIFEFESFLFQTKAFLDIYSQMIGMYFKNKPSNIKKLLKVLNEQSNEVPKRLKALITGAEWIKDFHPQNSFEKSMRDIIAHYSRLRITPLKIKIEDHKKVNTHRHQIKHAGRDDLIVNFAYGRVKDSKKLLKKSFKIVAAHQNIA